MSNNCQKLSGFDGVSAESFSKMGSTAVRHAELLLSWDQQLRGVMKHPAASVDLVSLFSGIRKSGLRLSRLVTLFRSRCPHKASETFCCLWHFMTGRLFSSDMLCLLLCESTSGLFLCLLLMPLEVDFLFPMMQLESRGGTSTRLHSTLCNVNCVSSSLLSWHGDVWLAESITFPGLGLDECSETKVLSSFKASSSMLRSLSCSSLRHCRFVLKLCTFEPSSAVVSPLWRTSINN